MHKCLKRSILRRTCIYKYRLFKSFCKLYMYSIRPLIWSLFLWGLVFSFSWLTYIDAQVVWKSIPIVTNILTCVLLIILYSKDARNTKSKILALSWSIVVSIGVLFHTIDIIDDIALNVHIACMSMIVAAVWCITSHAEHVTEGGLHWYIWTMLVVFALCAAFNGESANSRSVYLFAIIISFISHFYYVWHILKVQSTGRTRCRHIFRVVGSLILFSTFLIASILTNYGQIVPKTRIEIIFSVEIAAAVIIIIDWVLGFSDNSINYNRIQTTPPIDNVA